MGDPGPTRLELPAGVVFDLDGTLVDNMPIHAEAFSIFASRHGLPPLGPADRARLDGKRNRDIFPVLFARALDEQSVKAYSDEKEAIYRDLSRGRLAPLRGLPRLLAVLAERRIGIALATSAPEPNVAHSLAELGLESLGARVARSDLVPRGKPCPDVFLAAAVLLGALPEACLAFEDAPMGVAAARAAGMTCVALATTFSPEVLSALDPPPHAVVRDFDDFLEGPGRGLLGYS
jgi:HAD superfamily hydrolase (TIGR01509 family)